MKNPLEPYGLPRDEWERLIHQYIFDWVNRKMLVLRLLDGHTVEEVAELCDYSVEQTKRRLKQSQTRLLTMCPQDNKKDT